MRHLPNTFTALSIGMASRASISDDPASRRSLSPAYRSRPSSWGPTRRRSKVRPRRARGEPLKPGTVAAAIAGYFASTVSPALLRPRAGLDGGSLSDFATTMVIRELPRSVGFTSSAWSRPWPATPANRAQLPGRAAGVDAARGHGRPAGRRSDYWRSGPKVPLRGVLHLDRGGHRGLRGEASEGHPSTACARAAAVHGSAPR